MLVGNNGFKFISKGELFAPAYELKPTTGGQQMRLRETCSKCGNTFTIPNETHKNKYVLCGDCWAKEILSIFEKETT